MSERTILASFPSSTKAAAAEKELKELGVQITQIDRVSKYPMEPDSHLNNPVGGEAVSLAALTETSGNNLPGDVGPLLAVDNAASGNSTEGELVGMAGFLLTAVVPEAIFDQAEKTIETNGGNF